MKNSRVLFISSLLVLPGSCFPSAQSDIEKSGSSESDTPGWLHGNCYAVKSDRDLNGLKLTVVQLGDKQSVIEAHIDREARDGQECHALLDDRVAVNKEEGRRFYVVSAKTPIDLGIGMVRADKSVGKDELILDFNKDGKLDSYSFCSTTEGIQFSIRDGAINKSTRLWSDYYYLGYDTEADCPVE